LGPGEYTSVSGALGEFEDSRRFLDGRPSRPLGANKPEPTSILKTDRISRPAVPRPQNIVVLGALGPRLDNRASKQKALLFAICDKLWEKNGQHRFQ